ncbi:MAG: glycerol-3-phosphate dehydrogenase, partial [Alphaproteobacteria bacterium]|nr:glycerol-3-phosphate dehydrogenase [Alphaproteobacteria bacterium]
NGVAIARDAAGRGLRVLLCEKGDLASATSSASSKLVHGGLRYLEHGDFRLVRESLAERETLLRMAPHLVRPMSFVLPQGPGSRPNWIVRAGLFLYDRLGGARSLPGARALDLRRDPLGAPLRAPGAGFVYADCRVDDARLTVTTARDAAARGAAILTRTALIEARREADRWGATLQSEEGAAHEVTARMLVNAAGPWVLDVHRRAGLSTHHALRLVKGSHIVVPRLYEGEHAYLLQNDDRRIVFVIPFEREFSLIGTTELPFTGDLAAVEISREEVAYLCQAVARWFERPPRVTDVVWHYAGVRPLYEDRARSASAVTRDYVFDLDTAAAPALSIFGGKLTTHRRLAEHALARLAPFLPETGPAWTAPSPLPGGEDLPAGGVAAFAAELARDYPELDLATADRLARSYGSEARQILQRPRGQDFGHGFCEAELRWLVEKEWAQTAEDVLWRRTKLGLVMSATEAEQIASCLAPIKRSDAPQAAAASARAGQTAYR